MDLLKKHFEKLILALALLVLIGTAVYLAMKVGALSKQIQEAPFRTGPKGKGVATTALTPYENALTALTTPPLWTNPASGLFGFVQGATDSSNQTVTPLVRLPDIMLQRVLREPFKLLFQECTWDETAKEGRNFQINFLTKSRSFFVPRVGMPVADDFESTGYTIARFERKTVTVDVPGIGKRERDVSEITLKREGEEPITLVKGRIAEPNPLALLICRAAPEPLRVRPGDTFDCIGRSYKVVDITATQAIILDTKSGEKQTLALPAAP